MKCSLGISNFLEKITSLSSLSFCSDQIRSVAQSCPTLCDPMNRSIRLLEAMVFPVVIYGCESWTIKKAECQRIDAFGGVGEGS